MTQQRTVLLIDGSNYTYRGNFSVQDLLTNRDGVPTNAVRGFFMILSTDLKVLRPTHLAVTFDRTRSYRRLALYPQYKGTRSKESGDVVKPQMQIIRRLLISMGIPTLGIVGEEADDIIATLAHKFKGENFKVLVSSTDKDFAALVSKETKIVEARSRRLLGISEVTEKFGVHPSKMTDYLTLMGDKIDNIPGVPGVAGKTAARLLNEYGKLQRIVGAARKGHLTPALGRNILEFHESGQLKLSHALVKLDTKVPLRFVPDRFKLKSRKPDHERVARICEELDMRATHTLLKGM